MCTCQANFSPARGDVRPWHAMLGEVAFASMARGTPEGCLPYDDARWGKREARTCLASGATFRPAREEAKALVPAFAAGEEHPEKPPPEAREEPGRGGHPREGEQPRETAWDGLNRACARRTRKRPA